MKDVANKYGVNYHQFKKLCFLYNRSDSNEEIEKFRDNRGRPQHIISNDIIEKI